MQADIDLYDENNESGSSDQSVLKSTPYKKYSI